jgi:hypothetical protein
MAPNWLADNASQAELLAGVMTGPGRWRCGQAGGASRPNIHDRLTTLGFR